MGTATTLTAQQILNLAEDWDSLRGDLEGANQRLTELDSELANNRLVMDELNNETLPALRQSLAENNAAMGNLRDVTLSDLNRTLAENSLEIDTLNNSTLPELRTELTSNSGWILELDSVTLPALNQRLADAELAVAGIDTTQLQLDLDAAEAAIANLNDTTLPNLNSRLGAAEADVDSALSQTGQLSLELATTSGRIDTLQTSTIPGLNNRLSSAEQDVSAIEGKFPLKAADVAFSVGGGNLLSNSNFGNGSAGLSYRGSAAASVIVADTEVGGKFALELTVPASPVDVGFMMHGTPASSRIPVSPGDKLVFSLYAKKIAGASVNGPRIGVEWWDAAGAYLSGSYSDYKNGLGTKYTRLFHSATVPTNAASASIVSYTGGSGVSGDKFRFKNLQLERGDVATAYAPKPDEILPGSITDVEIANDAVTAPKIIAGAVVAGKIAANAVTANEIAANAVTASEILAGEVTAGKIAANAITAVEIAADAVTASEIFAGSVNTVELAANAVTANEIAANAVTASEIFAGAVVAGKIAADAVTASEIAADAVTASEIFAGSVNTVELAANAVTANEIAADAVTASEIFAGSVNTVELAANAVTANEINADAVTSSEILAGAVKAIEIDAAAVIAGKINANAVTANEINADAVTSSEILAGAVKAVEIDAGAVVAGKIDVGAVTANEIQTGAVKALEIDAGAVVADKIFTGSVTTLKIDTGAVTSDKIFTNAVTADKILSGSIIADKIASGAITTSKLTVGGVGEELILNGNFQEAFADSGWDPTEGLGAYREANVEYPGGYSAVVHSVNGAYASLKSQFYPVAFGATYAATVLASWVGTQPNGLLCRVYYYDANKNYISLSDQTFSPGTGANQFGNSFSQRWMLSRTFSPPSTARWARLAFFNYPAVASGSSYILLNSVSCRKQLTGDLLVAGAITGDKLSATAIDGSIITGARIRTGADPGERVEISKVSGTKDIRFYSGLAGETNPGFLGISGIPGSYSSVELGSPNMNGNVMAVAKIELIGKNPGSSEIGLSAYSVNVANHASVTIGSLRDGGSNNSGTGAKYCRVTAAGMLYASTAAPSSRDVKHDIKDLDADYETILRLEGVTYRYNDAPDKVRVGFLADQAHDLGLYDLVSYEDHDNPDKPTGFDYDGFDAALLYVDQEQDRMIKTLQREVAVLKSALGIKI